MPKTSLSKKDRMSEDELAIYWGISKHTLQKWRSMGQGPVYIKIGGRVIYPKEYIWEYERTRLFRGSAHRISANK